MRYAYVSQDGEVVWHEQTLAEGPPPRQVLRCDKVYKRSYRTEQVGTPAAKGWPLECYASGVHPDQAQELRDEFKRLNLDVEVTKDGNPVYTSAAHRREALKKRGFFDRASYY